MKKYLLILLISLFLVGCKTYKIEQECDLEQIKLGTSFSISGSFFLGCGTISGDSTSYYYFYTNQNGAIRLRKVPHNRITIYYTKTNPKVYFKASSEVYDISSNGWTIEDIMSQIYNYSWDIYIPEGSLINNYDINIK